ncbi:MAG TPA: carboxypeptidase-like regulatory domain-containing protein, partial [Saprospiraceae bacterium]|nr:carboxypeptidase-like regulatory domain-containing protein [Saprospiraceae bacterium]
MNLKNLTQAALILLVLAVAPGATLGQRTITGTVYDARTGEPLIGATVVDKDNPSVGTITDFDGTFSLNVGANTTALIISYTGYNAADVSIVGVNKLTVRLNSGVVLEEVVIIGYGTVRRTDVTGSL